MSDIEDVNCLLGEIKNNAQHHNNYSFCSGKKRIREIEQASIDALAKMDNVKGEDISKCQLCGEDIYCLYCTPAGEETAETRRIGNEILDEILGEEKTCTLTWREDGTALADCSNCGEGQLYDYYNYCPNCGAKNLNLARIVPTRHLKPSVEDVSDLLINVDEIFNPRWVGEEPNRPTDPIEDPNDPGSWMNPARGKKFPAEPPKPTREVMGPFTSEYDEGVVVQPPDREHDPSLFAWECPDCKAYGDSIEGPRTMVCPECGSNVLPAEDAGKRPEKKCKCYKGSLLGPGWPKCPYCDGELPSSFISEGTVYADTDSILMLFCKKCNKIIRDPVWDEETHSPYCPDCKTTVVERSPDEEAGSK